MAVENVDGTDLKFKNPGRLLLVVIAFIFWGIGFLDLLGHESAEPDVLGSYSLPFFVFLLLYAATIAIWIVLFLSSNLLSRVADGVANIQNSTWLAITTFVGLASALWVILEWDRWSRLPGLQLSAFGLVLLAATILLFSGWRKNGGQLWRKVIAYPLFALVIIEAVIQIVAWAGLLPGTHTIGGDFAPYERIYYNAEGFRNGFANRYGWTFPDFSLDDQKERILIVGGSSVQALQVRPEQQLSALLSDRISQSQPEEGGQTEVIAIGLSGFGLSPFLYGEVLNELPGIIAVDEIVVLFHLGNDFQSPSPSANPIIYTVDETGTAKVQPADAKLRHDLTHYYLHGYLSFQPVETIRGNYLTPRVIPNLLRGGISTSAEANTSATSDAFDISRVRGDVTANYVFTEPGHAGIRATDSTTIADGNNFMFLQGGDEARREAFAVARGMLETAQETAIANGIALKVVTIPVFPEAFYDEFQTVIWEPLVGEYDLFLPERALTEFANDNDIPVLPMGQYMHQDGLRADEIRQLLYADGQGPFTPKGHAYFANAIYSCFYSESNDEHCPEGP